MPASASHIFFLAAKRSRLLALVLALCFGCLPSVHALRPSVEPPNRVETLATSSVKTRVVEGSVLGIGINFLGWSDN